MADEWDHEDDTLYWHGVATLERWFTEFFASRFSQVRAGSGDTLMDLYGLRERLEKEGLEQVASSPDSDPDIPDPSA